MKAQRRSEVDDVIAEVRDIRAQMWKEAGGTIEGYRELIRREAAKTVARPAKATKRSVKASRPKSRRGRPIVKIRRTKG